MLNNYKDIRTYADFVEFYKMNKVLCNDIIEATGGVENWELENGELSEYYDEDGNIIQYDEYLDLIDEGENCYEEPVEIFQYYIIGGSEARTLEDLTDEIVFYNYDLDIYVWGITHYGTLWESVPISLNI